MIFNGVDLPVQYLLMGILIFFALMAALGTWIRGGGLKREDAEELFNNIQEKNHQELQLIEKSMEQTRQEFAATQVKQRDEIQSRLQELENIVARVAREHGDTLSSGMESVGKMIDESDKRSGQKLESMITSLDGLDSRVKLAGEQMSASINELVRQQRDQKAQSTIQLCEALITSLGTLKSSIANQLTDTSGKHTVEASGVKEQFGELLAPAAAPAQWPAPGKDENLSSELQKDPSENKSWESPFGTDGDEHLDEEEYPLPADAGPESLSRSDNANEQNSRKPEP